MENVLMIIAKLIQLTLIFVPNAIEVMILITKTYVFKYNVTALKVIFMIQMISVTLLVKSLQPIVQQLLVNL